jgi:hypothetical protein
MNAKYFAYHPAHKKIPGWIPAAAEYTHAQQVFVWACAAL